MWEIRIPRCNGALAVDDEVAILKLAALVLKPVGSDRTRSRSSLTLNNTWPANRSTLVIPCCYRRLTTYTLHANECIAWSGRHP